MEILAASTSTAIIPSAIDSINLTEWLFTLNEQEYRACAMGHIACGSSLAPEGKRMSLNVEQVGDSLLVQHYVEDISLRNQCRVNSISDSFSPAGQTRIGVTWELKIDQPGDDTCILSNHVAVSLTPEFAALLLQAGVTDLRPVKDNMLKNLLMQ